jgi:D-alanyl-lipoteichoic acid acyltransferase DltB (MBOAT superfamily)
MLFNSLEFLIFFPTVTALYFLLPHRLRWPTLLCASCIFYVAFIPQYLLILAVTIVIDYVAGVWLDRSDVSEVARKRILTLSILSTCLVLFVFKYFNFFNESFAAIARAFGWRYPVANLSLILPIGLSFHTFQSLSYVIEVYRRNQRAEHHFGIYALYVMFYPQLVAGPIERPQNLLHQFREPHAFEYRRVTEGLKLMLWGMFKKVVIADRLAIVVNEVYGHPHRYTGVPLVVATVFFAFQIYCDFSGYSDIALGAAQVMGFRLMENFRRPYFSRSISEFWTRWHISLSTWFRDYFYIPLGGNRGGTARWQRNLMLTFIVSGLWHGASWTFVAWGALNGFYLVCSIWTRSAREAFGRATSLARHPELQAIVRIAITFSLVCVSWIFFRATSIADAWYIATHLGRGLVSGLAPAGGYGIRQMGLDKVQLAIAVGSLAVLGTVQLLQERGRVRERLLAQPRAVRYGLYFGLALAIFAFGEFKHTQFIYFQF